MSSVAEAQTPRRRRDGNRWAWWSDHRPHMSVIALGVLFVGVVWSGLLLHTWEREVTAFDQARRDVSNLSIALEEQVERMILGADQVMRFVEAAYKADPNRLDLTAWAGNSPSLKGFSLQIAVADARGNIIMSSMGALAEPHPNIADREHFRVHVSDPNAGLFVSRPVLDRVSNRWSIQLSRRWNRADGTLAGVLLVSLDPDYLSRLFSRIDVGPSGSVMLLGRDGYIRARTPALPGMFERVFAEPGNLAEICPEIVRGVGTCRIASPLDSVERIFAVRPMRDLPLVVLVGQAVDMVSVSYHSEHRHVYLLASVLTAVMAIVVLVLIRQLEIRRRKELELRSSQEKLTSNTAHFAATLDNIDQGLLMVDPHGRIQVCNRRAVELLDLPQEIIDRKPLFNEVRDIQVARGELKDGGFDARDPLTVPPNTSLVYERRRPDGRILEVRTVRLADSSAVRTYTDVTKRKEAECAAQKARVDAERESEAKTEFLATMSHEIRTPLNSILGFTGLILERPDLDPGVRRQVQLIQGSGSALLTIVNDILDFSKIEAGQIELDPRPFELEALVGGTLSIVRGLAGAKRLEIRSEVDPDLPRWLVGDEDRIRQILLNFLNNALKFTREGQVTLSVRCEASSGAGERIRFAVADTGIGIPKAKQHLLFRRFSQIDGSIRREFGGTGLGLAISQRLVDLMGGEIGVESEHRQGATFWFTVGLPKGEPASALTAPAQCVTATGRKARILLAEDVEVNQEIARTVLEGAGHSVDIVSDGSEAIMAVQEGEYDLVLMDIQMPVVDGVTATRRIRELDGSAGSIPIIAMTANVLPEQVAKFMAAGMTGHVGKPFKREELYDAVERVLGEGGGADASQADAASALDEAAYGSLVELMGTTGVRRLLENLEGRLHDLLQSRGIAPADRKRVAAEAHALVSAAGMLGFRDLSDAFRALETACLNDTELEPVLDRVRGSLDATLTAIAALKAAA